MKASQMRMSKDYLFRLSNTRESATIVCVLAEIHRQAEEWESFTVGRKEDFRCALSGSSWHEEAVHTLTGSGAS